ncbi:MAG: hypothetical protein JRI59_03075 [Deltaproteobacteria bacterium]|nr:hypothetical protein [Deltaproteobacteria bacterium]
MFQLDPLLAVAVLAGLHIWCGRWRFIRSDRHSNWLSFSGGAAVAYVFMGLLPKLSLWQAEVLARRQAEPAVPRICEALGIVQWCGGLKNFLIYDIFLSALAGLVFFYWVDWLVQHKRPPGGPGESQAPYRLFLLHIGIFAAYNVLIGYLIVHHVFPGKLVLMLLVIALGLHFLGINHSLWKIYREKFDVLGRWVFAVALFLGWLLGVLTELAPAVYIGMYSFVAGGIIMNVFNEEMPHRHEARFWPFFFGVVGYSLLLIVIYAFK